MTTDLEKKFFDTFEIPEICERGRETCEQYNRKCDNCPYFHYPQITERILLELMALLMKQEYTEFYYHDDEYLFSSKSLGSNRPTCNRVNNLRELILRTATCLGGFTPLKNEMLPQVQELFKE